MMPRRISARKRASLIHDLIHADFDLTALRSKYGLSPDALSHWVHEEPNHRCLTGLCVLADIQTQLLLSRYRLIAAGRLIDMATHPPEDSRNGHDTSRRACVDLLKLDLPRAEVTMRVKAAEQQSPFEGLEALHRLVSQEAEDRSLPRAGDGQTGDEPSDD